MRLLTEERQDVALVVRVAPRETGPAIRFVASIFVMMIESPLAVPESEAPDHCSGKALIDDGIGDHADILRRDEPKFADDVRFLSLRHLPVLNNEIHRGFHVVVVMC